MTLNEYQEAAIRTAGDKTGGAFQPNLERGLTITALGIAGEAGEVADYVKKVVGHGHDLDAEKLVKELGDVLWYVAVMAAHLEVSLSSVAQANINKLRKRYPNGFSTAASVNRFGKHNFRGKSAPDDKVRTCIYCQVNEQAQSLSDDRCANNPIA